MDEILLPKRSQSSKSPKKEPLFSFPNPNSSWHHLQDTHLLNLDSITPVGSQSFTRLTTNSSFVNLITNLNKRRIITHRSHSAPSLFTYSKEPTPNFADKSSISQSTPGIVSRAFISVVVYISIGVIVFVAASGSFKGDSTFRLVDALYFSVVTLCTIGYGDIVPNTTLSKLFTCGFILVGFGFIDILLNGLVTYVLDRQEAVLISTMDASWSNAGFRTYIMDMKKGRMRIRMKVCLALAVVIGCIALGMVMVRVLEGLSWVDSFYLSVTSVTTVGYGDYAFKTLKGRLFASVWLLVSTLAVARAFLYMTELRIEKRNRAIAKWVLQKKMTIGDLVAADLDNDGSISKSEYVIYKLKEMGKIAEKDILQICNQFDRLDSGNCGKITLSDLMEGHH
ncbi:two pore potassium channel c-like isoform X2 [Tasmannia lanceolata]|uniref:two pore potassium channel c-like isoform X2 n=1 Tax=Tasmannia lanceolata TaxID=3420 RepID=UPI004062BBB1